MKYYTTAILAATFSAAVTAHAGHGHSVFDPIFARGDYSTLLTALNETGSDIYIEGLDEPVTIFGPKDSVFTDFVANVTARELNTILYNHVVIGQNVTTADIIAAGCLEVPTAGGLKLGVKYDAESNTVTVNDVPVSDFDVGGKYGILHGIDGVLLGDFVPCPPPAILSPIVKKGTYNILLEGILGTGLPEDPRVTLPITIFGPKDSAFQAIASTISGMNEEQVKAILLNHVVSGANVTSADVVAAGCLEIPTAGGLKLGINFDNETSTVTVNNVTVSDFDVGGGYGILHGIDEVLLGDFVPCPVFEADFSPIAANGNYSALLSALVETGGDAAISAHAPVTILGPKDAALEAIQDTLLGLSPEEVLAVLENHVIVGDVVDSSFVTTRKCVNAETASGLKVAIRYNETTNVTDVNGIVIDDFDIRGNYGIFHGMNGVLLGNETYVPCPIPSFVEQVAWEGDFTTLLGFLEDPTLKAQLDAAGPITVFGPNDAAFEDVDLSGVDPIQLQLILGSHVVSGVYTSADVKAAGCIILDTIVGTKIRAMYIEGSDHHGHGHHRRRLASPIPTTTNHTDNGNQTHHDDHEDDHHHDDHHEEDHHDDHHDDHDDDHHDGHEGHHEILINEAHVIVADLADETSIFHGLDKILLSQETFECPTPAPVAAPTAAPAEDTGDKIQSSAYSLISSSSAVLAAVVALAAFAF